MVMRSFKRVKLSVKVEPEKANKYKEMILKRFKDSVTVKVVEDRIVVEGEGLSDYRIHDKIFYILKGEA